MRHTECSDTHVLLIDVQPFDDIARSLAIVAWTSHSARVTSQTAKRKHSCRRISGIRYQSRRDLLADVSRCRRW